MVKSRKKAEPFKDNQFFPEVNKDLLSPKKRGQLLRELLLGPGRALYYISSSAFSVTITNSWSHTLNGKFVIRILPDR